jgi:hypothetical protein
VGNCLTLPYAAGVTTVNAPANKASNNNIKNMREQIYEDGVDISYENWDHRLGKYRWNCG